MGAQGRRLLMEFKTAEQKLLHDYAALEERCAQLEYDNQVLEKRLHRAEVERDQRTDCILDMMATAKFYGIDQPQNVGGADPLPEGFRSEYGLATGEARAKAIEAIIDARAK